MQLTSMIVELRLENRRLSNKLAERKLEVQELKDEFCDLRHGLCAKMKHLYKTMGHKVLYDAVRSIGMPLVSFSFRVLVRFIFPSFYFQSEL